MELIGDAKLLAMTVVIISLFVALYLIKLIAGLLFTKKKYPPVVGTIVHQFFNLHRLHDFHTELSRRHKTFRFLSPTCNYVFTVDPANVEYILKTNFTNYGKGHSNYEILNDLFGDGIFAVDGEKWSHQRKVATLEFSPKVLRDYSSLVFRDSAVKLCELLFEAVKSNKAIIEIQDLFMKSTMDSIFKVGLDKFLKGSVFISDSSIGSLTKFISQRDQKMSTSSHR